MPDVNPDQRADDSIAATATTSAAEIAQLRGIAEQIVSDAAAHLNTLPAPVRASGVDVRTKSSPTDVVTANDLALETLIRARLAALRPGDGIVGEEHGGVEAYLVSTAGSDPTAASDGAEETVWVVDPIDGTVNYLYGLPWFAVSLAATRGGVSVAGAVIEPATGRLWSAGRGAGASCAGEPLTVSVVGDPAQAMVATGFAYQAPRRARQAAMVAGMAPHVRDIRRFGAASLDLCAVAAGWTDAYLEHGTHWWDWAAASLIAEEAGAVVRTPGPPGRPAPDDGLGPDALLAAPPGLIASITELAVGHGAGQV